MTSGTRTPGRTPMLHFESVELNAAASPVPVTRANSRRASKSAVSQRPCRPTDAVGPRKLTPTLGAEPLAKVGAVWKKLEYPLNVVDVSISPPVTRQPSGLPAGLPSKNEFDGGSSPRTSPMPPSGVTTSASRPLHPVAATWTWCLPGVTRYGT